ncbi:sulfurtransferase complex subunit TusB [Alkalimarinus sediminis]|uniref:sulfurtransferase complex subunit TusB n=1 Tax=Alkalimarinus sediminis TaxID=1632866 RepID=UPI0020442ADF|nr:sulfurtransferase complex subunit TusB [Alkalimarinus sediminis]
MTTLHILNRSPKQPQPASQCARFYSNNDSVLLIEDAVYYATSATYQRLLNPFQLRKNQPTPTVYALVEDLEARGLASLIHSDIKPISYDQFVDLTVTHDKTSSWY